MEGLYWLKFIGTSSMLEDYEDMLAATTLDTDRFEMELGVLLMPPDFEPIGDQRTAFNNFITSSRKDRLTIDVKFYPFSNHAAISATVPQNTNTLFQLRALLKNDSIWIALPSTDGRNAPPRWEDTVNFPLVAGRLPLWIERDPFEMSIVEADGETEVSILLKERLPDGL